MSMHGLRLRLRIFARCARVILAYRSLVIFPLVSMSFAIMALSFFYFTVGPDKLQLMLNTLRNEQGVQTLNMSYYGALAAALILVVSLSTAMNFALAHSISNCLNGQRTGIWDGMSLALKRAPAILIWSLMSLTLGLLWTLLDQERRSSTFLRRRFGNTWSNLSVLTVPVAVLENRNIVSAVIRSKALVEHTWGHQVTAHFGSIWFVTILSLPLVIKYALLHFSGAGITLPFAEFALVYLACCFILAQTAKAIFKVALYQYASEGIITTGFDIDLLASAFEAPSSGQEVRPSGVLQLPLEPEQESIHSDDEPAPELQDDDVVADEPEVSTPVKSGDQE